MLRTRRYSDKYATMRQYYIDIMCFCADNKIISIQLETMTRRGSR